MSKVAVVGLGYVGLPLAVALAKRGHEVIGLDIQKSKLERMKKGDDPSGEVSFDDLSATTMQFSDDFSSVESCEFIIIAVPTPITETHDPDFKPLLGASKAIAPYLKDGVIVVYESTVYPGVTEEVCAPVLSATGKVRGVDYILGYSPERINPGDKEHTIDKIVKVVSAETPEALDKVDDLYSSIVDVGVHRAPSIMVAEAAKVIENTQRDLNIALMNELALIFDRVGIRTSDVLKAAGTKWNFLKFFPGLVGGHCIGVDPYYLTYRAKELGYIPQVITAGRRINDNMGKFIAEKTVKLMIRNDHKVKSAKVLVLGLTFKENVPDFRNSRVVDIIHELQDYQIEVIVHDPFAAEGETPPEYDVAVTALENIPPVEAIILAVAHDEYKALGSQELKQLCLDQNNPILIDVKGLYAGTKLEDSGFDYWTL